MFPYGAWVLETNREYIITVDVYDKLNHKLYVAEVSDFHIWPEAPIHLLEFTYPFHFNRIS